ncbi:MAG TPA: YggT family protein [Patescibacteria group bacterium]|nr:YggT family protein [Patescibacteria group bacterium]
MISPQIFATRLVNLFTGIVLGFLSLRFVLKLFGANADNGFVGWVYDNTAVLLEPFRGIFSNTVIERDNILEFNTLFAMLVYALLGMLIIMVIGLLTPASTKVVKKKK